MRIDFKRFIDDTEFVWGPRVRKFHEPGRPKIVEVYETSDPKKLIRDPFVSIVILTYNHGEMLSDCLDSVLMQETEYPFEIIIANDVSTDDLTNEICSRYQKDHSDKIRLLNGNANVGSIRNAVRGIERCRGKYIACIDGDDFYLSKKKIQRQVAYLVEHSDVSLCMCSFYQQLEDFWFARVPITRRSKRNYSALNDIPKGDRANIILKRNCLAPICSFFTAESGRFACEKIKSLFEIMEWFPCQDFELWYYMALKGKVHFIPEELCVYRTNSTSASNNDDNVVACARMFGDYCNKLAMIQDAPPCIKRENIDFVERNVLKLLAEYVRLTSAQELLSNYLNDLLLEVGEDVDAAPSICRRRSIRARFRISLLGYLARKVLISILRL